MFDEMDEDKKASLDELLAFARQGMGRNMRKRLGKPMPPEEGEEMPPDIGAGAPEEIPGVEPAEGDGGADVSIEASGSGVDPEQLQQILEALRAGK